MLILSAVGGVGGTERAVLLLSAGLARRGIGVSTVFSESAEAPDLLDWCRRSAVTCATSTVVRSDGQSHSLRDMLRFRALVRRSSADVVSLHYGGDHISFKDVLCTRLAGKRCVVQVHYALSVSDAHKRRMTRWASRLAQAVVVGTPAVRDVLLQAGVHAEKMHLIPFGLSPPEVGLSRPEARRRLGVPDDAFVVGSVGRLTPMKGFDGLIEAVAMLPDPEGRLRLIIAGDGPDKERLVALGGAALGDRFRSLGQVLCPDDLYASSDVFALASRAEGFGLVFVEAAFHGVPSVAMDVGGVRSAVRNQETGLLVPADDITAFSAAIDRLRADSLLRHRLGTAARVRAHSEFSLDRLADRYLAVLNPRPRE